MTAPSSPTMQGRLRLHILGPLRIWHGDVEVHVGPRQQAHLLALLLARQGRQTSISELIDMIWGFDVPASAVNAIHKYVGALRRVLEPALLARETGTYLRRRGNGYVCSVPADVLDLARFRELRGAATAARSRKDRDTAHDRMLEALRLWTGPAGADLTLGPEAAPVFAGLNQEFFSACVSAAELAVILGQPAGVLPSLQLAASMAPLHEPVQASLVVSLAAAGHQAEALSVFTTVRSRLADELGIDPGPALRAAHHRVLSQNVTPGAELMAVRVPVRQVGASSRSGACTSRRRAFDRPHPYRRA